MRIGFCTTLCVLSIDRQERCEFFLNFVIFLNQRTRESCISDRRDVLVYRVTVLHYKWHLRRWRASEKRFGFLKEERKCSDSSVVRGFRLVSKLSDITCTCLALDLAITAHAGHFTDSVCKNLAAVEKKKNMRR